MEDEHIIETMGMTKVVIKDGRVVSVGEPKLRYCPLFNKHRGIKRIDVGSVKKNIEQRIREFGLFTADRDIEQETFVGFGASEVFMTALRCGMLDSVVSVCDGAGTVVTSNPALVQGIGARLSGLMSTSPIKRLIERIEDASGHVIYSDNAKIDQVEGVKWAIEKGFRNIGVTLTSLKDAKMCKCLESEGIRVITFIVHASELSFKDDINHCDLVTSCASKALRSQLNRKACLQAGKSIPIFALSQIGKELLLERAKEIETPILMFSSELPVCTAPQPEPLL
ncbi:MAG: methanogenesis marker 8 protein [Candidatus Methanofastidiosia archaeon]